MSLREAQEQLDRAVVEHRRGNEAAALELYEKVLTVDPVNATANSNLAIILRRTGKIDRAAACLQRAIVYAPQMAAAYNNLGNLLRENAHRDKAPAQNERCIVLTPLYAEGLNNLGLSLPDDAGPQRQKAYRKALLLKPDYSEGWLNLANLSGAMRTEPTDRLPGVYYRRSLKIRADYATAISSYGVYRASIGELSAAIVQQERALKLDPSYEEAYFNLALYYLLSGRFHEGFSLYEHGIGGRSAEGKRGHPRRVGQPRWKGESLTGKSILVTAEQGVGDEIMFSSLIPELTSRAKTVYLESTPRLTPIMRRSYPSVNVFMYNPKNPSPYLGDQSIDYSLPLGSLPLYFRKCAFDFGRQRPYAVPNASLARHFRQKYKAMFPDRLLVGFSWRGGSGLQRSKARSITLDTMMDLLSRPGVQAISLQYGVKEPEKEWFEQHAGSNVFYDDTVEPLTSMDIALAQIAAMDLVISVTNAAVHSAGALGQPCWILVPHISDWRWTWGREDVVWYPGMRSFRQETVGDWSGPLARIDAELEALLKGNGSLRARPAPDMDWRGDL